MSEITFASLSLSPAVLAGLASLQLKPLSPVESKAIPALLAGRSAVVLSPTGSGKTFSYLIPILDSLARDGVGYGTVAIVVVPTVALGFQVRDTLEGLARTCGLRGFTSRFFSSSKEAESGRIVPDVAILTPQLFKPFTKAIDTKKVQRVIFDEGDMILFDGFLDEMEQACQMIPNARKSFFSASLGSQWLTRVKRMCHAEEIIDISQGRINGANIRHILVDLRGAKRSEGLLKLLSAPEVADGRTIVFVSRREELKQVAYDLKRAHVRFESISGELDKRGISKVISGFVDGDFQVLLATDFASRGLDLPEVKSVISYTLPIDQGYYFHRAGRSGRFDAPGTSYVLCGKEDLTECRALQRKGAGFTFMAVKKDGVSSVKSAPVSHLNQIKGENSYLTKAIVEAKRRYPLGHVKPGYKKKIKTAIRVAKSKHKKKILRTNLGKKDLTHGV